MALTISKKNQAYGKKAKDLTKKFDPQQVALVYTPQQNFLWSYHSGKSLPIMCRHVDHIDSVTAGYTGLGMVPPEKTLV